MNDPKPITACPTCDYTHAPNGPCITGIQGRAYRALQIAAERMGFNNWKAGREAHVRAGRKASTYRYTPTEEHRQIVAAMDAVLRGTITPEDAMALLWQHDTMKQRIAS
jgi:hypothetical protein